MAGPSRHGNRCDRLGGQGGPNSGPARFLLNSMDADGTKSGLRPADDHGGGGAVVDVPVGRQRRGPGQLADFAPAVEAGADAVLAA